jgi:hypothetical protein
LRREGGFVDAVEGLEVRIGVDTFSKKKRQFDGINGAILRAKEVT